MERPFAAYKGDEPYLFVSYAHDDAALVYSEISALRNQGFNIWYDEGIRPGTSWRDEVALALTQCSVFLYFITPRSVASSNCLNEVNFCLSRERKVLCIHLENTELPIGLELSLSAMQAIIKADHASEVYVEKLTEGLKSLMPKGTALAEISPLQSKSNKPDVKSIAILPFVNRSNDPDNEYLCDGLAEELITGLAKIDDLKVSPQLSSFGLKGQSLTAQEIGIKLKIANVLTGSIQKSGERVRITTTLSATEHNEVLWSERYDGTLEDVFELQEDVANKVIKALKVELIGEPEHRVIDAGTSNAVAYENFLLGKHEFLKATRSGFAQAREYFAKALSEDPEFGRVYWIDTIARIRQRDIKLVPEAGVIDAASTQIERMKLTGFKPPMPSIWIERIIDPGKMPDFKSMAKETLAKFASRETDWQGYEYLLMARHLSVAGLLNAGREFFAHYNEQLVTYPDDPRDRHTYSNLLFALGHFDKAIQEVSNIIAKDPQDQLNLGTRAMLYSRTGQYAKADVDLALLAKTFPRNFAQFYDLYWRRDLDAARAYFEWLDRQRNLFPQFKIWACFLLGYIDKGLDYVELDNWSPAQMRVFALYPLTPSIKRTVTAHPKYKAILDAHGLDDVWRDELMAKVNALESITGIHVALDEDY